MFIEKRSIASKIGETAGFLFSYTLFTAILFMIMSSGRGRSTTVLMTAMLVTAGVLLSGAAIKRLLK